MKLISMTDFVLEQKKNSFYGQIESSEILQRIENYAEFLKQPLTLGIFVPCDEQGNFLKEPDYTIYAGSFVFEDECKAYGKAKEKVLFKTEFKMDEANAKHFVSTFETIDNLAQLYEFELTESSKKQIGL